MAKDKNKLEIKFFEENKIMKLNDILSSLKVVAIILMIFSAIATITIVVLSTLTTLSVATSTNEQLLKNDSVIDFIAKMNSYSISGANDVINNIGSKGWFITFYVILPSLFVIAAFVCLIVFSKKLLNFIKDVKTNKSLFTTEKLNALKKLRAVLLSAGLLFFLAFDFSYFIIYLILELTLEIILYLFNYCVKVENSKEK